MCPDFRITPQQLQITEDVGCSPKSVKRRLGMCRNSAYSCAPSCVLCSCSTSGLRVTIPFGPNHETIKQSITKSQKNQRRTQNSGPTWPSRQEVPSHDALQHRWFPRTLYVTAQLSVLVIKRRNKNLGAQSPRNYEVIGRRRPGHRRRRRTGALPTGWGGRRRRPRRRGRRGRCRRAGCGWRARSRSPWSPSRGGRRSRRKRCAATEGRGRF